MGSVDQQHFLYLLDRPSEPIFFPKGFARAVFAVPNDFLDKRFGLVDEEVAKLKMRGRSDEVIQIPIMGRSDDLPDFDFLAKLGRKENFSLFIPLHQQIAGALTSLFINERSAAGCLTLAAYLRDRINPYLFVYCLSVALLHRPDTKTFNLPSLSETFPDKFVDGNLIAQAKEQAHIHDNEKLRIPLEVPMDNTASDLEPEHRVAYFREDLGINLHHSHWHLVYPVSGPKAVVDKDRRGELFYYMHQQIIARYNIARLCERLGRVKRLTDLREPLEEGYFPKLDSKVASRTWIPRHAGAKLSNINRPDHQMKFDISDLERWRDRIVEAISLGKIVHNNGEEVELTPTEGIDILGNIVESSSLSLNRNLYGDLHNSGHVLIALSHDPDNRHLENFGVMGDTATAMRDPAFYRWHATIDDIFQKHKQTMPSYTVDELEFEPIRITAVRVIAEGGWENVLPTSWQQHEMDLSRGMDFAPSGSMPARVTLLKHNPFAYNIQVVNNSGMNLWGTVRIFLAPKFDERGLPMTFNEQRLLMVEMDKFPMQVMNNPMASTCTITRDSSKSSITIPFERTFRDLESIPKGQSLAAFNYCGCGWPQHMLVPKGTLAGYPCQLFVMISNINDDLVEGSLPGIGICAEASSFCGIRDKKYPDKRSMGFPFDRKARRGVETLEQFLTHNMAVIDVSIKFHDIVYPPNTGVSPSK